MNQKKERPSIESFIVAIFRNSNKQTNIFLNDFILMKEYFPNFCGFALL